MSEIFKKEALEYHEKGSPGKIEVVPIKSTKTQRDLSLAYSPGVAEPCKAIHANIEDVYRYTRKGNLVAVISNGTAVLGLGDIGPEASKPVMEGKGILFKIFAGIDVFDIEINAKDVDEFCRVVKSLEPTFGGINLEDIKAPECFEIEERLKREMKIPIMHDDQHGTAIITGAGLLNAAELVGKKLEDIKLVVSGAGASAISCVKIFIDLGIKKSNVIMCDSKGVIYHGRPDLNEAKKQFASHTSARTLEEAIVGADMFLGLSTANVFTPKMLLSMAPNPIVFALANPDPEIDYHLAVATRSDVIMATGRSDFPNQVNNVLGFPFIFRGALDVRATEINEQMKLAAVKAIASLAKMPVPQQVLDAYNQKSMSFGKNYIIPKPLDPRLLTTVAPAVAKAAMDSGVAKVHITDWEAYKQQLLARMGSDENLLRRLISKAKQDPKRIVFAEAEDARILKAAQIALDEKICYPILLGRPARIKQLAQELGISLEGMQLIDVRDEEHAPTRKRYSEIFFQKRQRKGYNTFEAHEMMRIRNYYGAMMVEVGDADAMLSGVSRKYADTIKPALEIIGTYQKGKKVVGMYLLITKNGPLFLADTTMIAHPTAQELADMAKLVARTVREDYNIEPRVAMLSYSSFGASNDEEPTKMRKAVEMLKNENVDFVVDGEIQAKFAFDLEALRENYPFSELNGATPNILIFPNLSAANIAYQLLQEVKGIESIGPIIVGLNKPVHILQMGSSVRQIVNMIAIATVDAQSRIRQFSNATIEAI
ncbi:MAG: NADP-dependent malic enzyme [Flammeovirgaceae bacterium]|nr:NADP-dependent malic enzyme [Flammeovirgaceae bacterium]MDW8286757.1 NADP-dependent malic enzyme [Flammeovirgaceae bacterium]